MATHNVRFDAVFSRKAAALERNGNLQIAGLDAINVYSREIPEGNSKAPLRVRKFRKSYVRARARGRERDERTRC